MVLVILLCYKRQFAIHFEDELIIACIFMNYQYICLFVGFVCITIHIFNSLSSNQLLQSLQACGLRVVEVDSVDTR